MEIIFLGHSSFRIKGKDVVIVTDPFDEEMLGFKYPRVEADIVTVSHEHNDHNKFSLIGGNPFIISRPGEYEIKGASIFGISSFHDDANGAKRGQNICYLFDIDGIKILHCGDLGTKFTDNQLSVIGDVDVVLIPVGGEVTLDSSQAAEVATQLEPKIIIPMHYKELGINDEVFGKLAEVKDFTKRLGDENTIPQPKLIISKLDLPEQTKVIVLERKSG